MSFYNGQMSSITVIIQHFKMCRSPHDGGCSPEGILVYHTHIVSNGEKSRKNNCTVIKSKDFFCKLSTAQIFCIVVCTIL